MLERGDFEEMHCTIERHSRQTHVIQAERRERGGTDRDQDLDKKQAAEKPRTVAGDAGGPPHGDLCGADDGALVHAHSVVQAASGVTTDSRVQPSIKELRRAPGHRA